MNLYNKDYNKSNDFDGEFIFGDILGDFYPEIDKKYSYKKIASTYTGSSNRKNDKMNILEWGILFQVFYQLKNNEKEKKYIYMNSFVLVRVFRPFEKAAAEAASEVASGEVNDVTSSTASSEAGDEE